MYIHISGPKKLTGRAGSRHGKQSAQMAEHVSADGLLQILLCLGPTRHRLLQLPSTCRGETDQALTTVLPRSKLDPAPLFHQAQHSCQRRRIQCQKLGQVTLRRLTGVIQDHQQRELRDLNAVGTKRLVVQPRHRPGRATQVGARAREHGQARLVQAVVSAHNRCIYMFSRHVKRHLPGGFS